MFPHYLLVAIIGWCGTGWPIHFPSVGGGGVEPGDWPTNCPMCGQILGAISAVVLVAITGFTIETAGIATVATTAFFGGSFGTSLVGGVLKMAGGKR